MKKNKSQISNVRVPTIQISEVPSQRAEFVTYKYL